jgi:hypothetical protein
MHRNRLHPAFHRVPRIGWLAALALLATTLAGCGGMTGSQSFTQVRVIDASPDAPALDIYQNSPSQPAQAGLYNIGFGTVTSYIPLAPGAYTHAAFTAGTQQQLAQVRGAFSTGTQYTVLTGNIAANLQMSILRDQSTPAPAGQVALRFLGQATRAGTVDLYLVAPGASLASAAPIAASIGFGSNTGYLNAPSGTYSIVALPSGSHNLAAPAYTGSQVSYPGGAARTIILIDDLPPAQQPASAPSLQLITANDYDPAAS